MAKSEPPGIKINFIQQFEVLENLEDLYGKCCWRARSYSSATFPPVLNHLAHLILTIGNIELAVIIANLHFSYC